MSYQPGPWSNASRVPASYTEHFTFRAPLSGNVILPNADDKIRVSVTRSSSSSRTLFYAKIFESTDTSRPVPANNTNMAGWTQLAEENNTTPPIYSSDNVPIGDVPTAPPTANNKVLVVACYDGGGTGPISGSLGFKITPRSAEDVSVSAKSCLWLAYAPTDVAGNAGETQQLNAPVRIEVPEFLEPGHGIGTNQHLKVTITPKADDEWFLDALSFYPTDANGFPLSTVANTLGYKSADLNSLNIAYPYVGVNDFAQNGRMIGMWDHGPEELGNNLTFDVGLAGLSEVEVPNVNPSDQRVRAILLACHTHEDWTPHQGRIRVNITWTIS